MNEQNTASSRITILPTYWDDTTDIQYMLGKDTVLKSVQMSGAGGGPFIMSCIVKTEGTLSDELVFSCVTCEVQYLLRKKYYG